MSMLPLFITVSSILVCILPYETLADSSAPQLRRLRNSPVLVPDLGPLNPSSNLRAVADHHAGGVEAAPAGFEPTLEEAKLEEFFFDEVFRLDLGSMSFSMSYGYGGGGGGASGDGGTQGADRAEPGTDGMEEPLISTGGPGRDQAVGEGEKCGVSDAGRAAALFSILSSVSDPALLTDLSSSRGKAFNWLANEDTAKICPTSRRKVVQRYRAALIYYQLGGPGWNNCRADGGPCFQEDSNTEPAIPFLDSSNECLWFGLSCQGLPREVAPSERGMVSPGAFYFINSVDISDNSLSGELYEELFGFSELIELTLDGNKDITGTIPEAIGHLTKLVALDIDDNKLYGPIPDALFTLTTLEAIDLNANGLTGGIPNEIGALTNLVVVQLDNNNLEGPMPSDGLFQLQELAVWTLLDNGLTGSVENVCSVLNDRRAQNGFAGYLQFFWVDCSGRSPKVECSCCECQEPQNHMEP